jgi:hypothetical protein
MRKINKLLPLLLMATMLSACTKTTSVRHHKDFQNQLTKAKTLAILPASVEVVTVDASGKTTRNYDYEQLVEDVILDVLMPKLGKMGYNTKFLSRGEIHKNKLSRDVLNFREDYNGKIAQLYKTVLLEEEKAHNVDLFLEKPAKEVAKLSESDLVVFVEYYLRAKTSGACTKDIALSVLSSALIGSSRQQDPNELLSLRIAIINPYTGQFVWSNFTTEGFGSFFGAFNKNAQKVETDRLKDVFDTLLKKLPDQTKS